MSTTAIVFMLVALVEAGLIYALASFGIRQAAEARQSLNLIERHYKELKALGMMNSWALDRAHTRLREMLDVPQWQCRLIALGAIREIVAINQTDPAEWQATPVLPLYQISTHGKC